MWFYRGLSETRLGCVFFRDLSETRIGCGIIEICQKLVYDGALASGCHHLNCKLAKTMQENNCRIPCLVYGEHSGQPVTRYYCLENMYVRGK